MKKKTKIQKIENNNHDTNNNEIQKNRIFTIKKIR